VDEALQVIIQALLDLDIEKSKEDINKAINTIQEQVKNIEITAVFNADSLKNLEAVINSVKETAAQGVSLAITGKSNTSAIENVRTQLESISKQASSTSRTVSEALEGFIPPDTFTRTASLEKEIRRTFENAGDVTTRFREDANGNISSFTASVKLAEDQIANFNYSYRKLGEEENAPWGFAYTGMSATDNSSSFMAAQEKQYDTLSSKVVTYTAQLEKIKRAYSDINSSKAITESSHLESLSAEYDKALTSIKAFSTADSTQSKEAEANVKSRITSLQLLVKEYQNAEYAASELRAKDITSVKADEQNRLTELTAKIQASSVSTQELENKLQELNSQLSSVKTPDELTKYLNAVSNLKTEFSALQTQAKIEINAQNAAASVEKLKADIEAAKQSLIAWGNENSKGRLSMPDFETYLSSYDKLSSNVGTDNISQIRRQFQALQSEVRANKNELTALGQSGKTTLDDWKDKLSKFSQWFSVSQIMMTVFNQITQSIDKLVEVDTILTEISKTSDRTAESLEELGNSAYETASQYGTTAENYLTAVEEMNRAGFQGDTGDSLAELSLLAQTAGDVTADVANDYLIATNAAYDYGGSVEKLSAVLDGQNKITNLNSVSMQDMADATKEAASMAAQSGVEVDELSALISTAVSKTRQSGTEAGNAIKSILTNLTNTTNSKIVQQYEDVGISMTKIVDGATQLKTPIELLKELSEVYMSLPEGNQERSEILTVIGGKYQANTLAALLSGMDDYEKALSDYASGEGSAMQEAEKTANSLQGRLNTLSNTWDKLVKNVTGSALLKTGVEFGTSLVSVLEKITSHIDTLGGSLSVLAGIAGGLGTKGILNSLDVSSLSDFRNLFSGTDTAEWGTNFLSIEGFDEQIREINSFADKITELKSLNTASMTESFNTAVSKSDNDIIKEAAKNYDILNQSADDFANTATTKLYVANLNSAKGFGNVKTAITAYNAAAGAGQTQANQIAAAIGSSNSSLGAYLINLNGAKASLTAYGVSLVATTAKQVALNVAVNAFAAGIGIVISAVLSKVITAIQNYANRAEEAAEAHKEFIEETKEQVTELKEETDSLNELISQYEEYAGKTSLTSSDKERLAEIQQELIDSYGIEADSIDLVNGKYEDNLRVLKEIAKQKAQDQAQAASTVYDEAKKNYNSNKTNQIVDDTIIETYNKDKGTTLYKNERGEDRETYARLYKLLGEVEGLDFNQEREVTFSSDPYDETSVTPSAQIKQTNVTTSIGLAAVDSAEKVEILRNALDDLQEHKSEYTDDEGIVADEYTELESKLTKLKEYNSDEVESYKEALTDYAEGLIKSQDEIDGVDYYNVTEDTYEKWAKSLIQAYEDNGADSEVISAIADYLNTAFGTAYGTLDLSTGVTNAGEEEIIVRFKALADELEDIKSKFDFESFFASENEDEENIFDKAKDDIDSLRDSYQSLLDGEDVDTLDLFKDFPTLAELTNGAKDTESLLKAMQQLSKQKASGLITQLSSELRNTTDETTKEGIRNLISLLQELSDLSAMTASDNDTEEETQALEDQSELIQAKIDGYEEIISSLEDEKDRQNDILDSLQSQKEELEDIISDYETSASVVTSAIEDEISTLEEQKSLIEDKYNAEIEALQAENEERDRNIDLREKEIALDKAKNTKVRVYSASQGWTVRTDAQSVADAQKEYDDALNEQKIAELETQRDKETAPYDEQITELENYKQAWQDAVDSYQNAQNEMTAAATLGSDWRERIYNRDTEIISEFAQSYNGFQEQLHGVVEPQITDVQNLISAYESQITQYENLKSAQEQYLEDYQSYIEKLNELKESDTTGVQTAIVTGTKAVITQALAGSYADGGVIDSTGTAQVHGTKTSSEVVFSSADAKKLYDYIHNTDMSKFLPKIQSSIAGELASSVVKNVSSFATTQSGSTSNSYSWVMTGNTIKTDNYSEFKGYMDRYVREMQMDLAVGRR